MIFQGNRSGWVHLFEERDGGKWMRAEQKSIYQVSLLTSCHFPYYFVLSLKLNDFSHQTFAFPFHSITSIKTNGFLKTQNQIV